MVMVGSQQRPAEEVLTALRKGSMLQKYGRRGTPKYHLFRLSQDDTELQWESGGGTGRLRKIPLSRVKRVQQGQLTAIFKRYPQPKLAHLSLSLIYVDDSLKERSLDVICSSTADFETWFLGIQLVVTWLNNPSGLKVPAYSSSVMSDSSSVQRSKDFPLASRYLDNVNNAWNTAVQRVEQLLQTGDPGRAGVGEQKAAAWGQTGGPKAGGGPLGLPPRRELGDLYIWGALSAPEDADTRVPNVLRKSKQGTVETVVDSLVGWQESAVPVLVNNTHSLDVIRTACGPCHAALITRSGEIYTWGYGKLGALGHSSQFSCSTPKLVSKLTRHGLRAIACNDNTTAAIDRTGRLYTWGWGAAGQLGHGRSLTVYEPKLVRSLDGCQVMQVACGPYHTAAVTSTGCLFTWGHGLCGKLGHGSEESFYSPKRVQALDNYYVTSVSCGWWHTAAVAVARRTRDESAKSGTSMGSELPYSGSLGFGADPAALQDLPSPVFCADPPIGAEFGGTLFTWGADFTWTHHDDRHDNNGKKDSTKGCLGLGDTQGRLLPTPVKGNLQNMTVKKAACGVSFTVALTADGRIYQMGTTGATNTEEKVAWEGAKAPTLVDGNLFGMFIEDVSAGQNHVAIVASRTSGNGRIIEDAARTRLLTWGKGSHGQLGLNSEHLKDHSIPQVVAAVDGRRVLHICCGGNQTLGVFEYDFRETRHGPRVTLPPMTQGSMPTTNTRYARAGSGNQGNTAAMPGKKSGKGAGFTAVIGLNKLIARTPGGKEHRARNQYRDSRESPIPPRIHHHKASSAEHGTSADSLCDSRDPSLVTSATATTAELSKGHDEIQGELAASVREGSSSESPASSITTTSMPEFGKARQASAYYSRSEHGGTWDHSSEVGDVGPSLSLQSPDEICGPTTSGDAYSPYLAPETSPLAKEDDELRSSMATTSFAASPDRQPSPYSASSSASTQPGSAVRKVLPTEDAPSPWAQAELAELEATSATPHRMSPLGHPPTGTQPSSHDEFPSSMEPVRELLSLRHMAEVAPSGEPHSKSRGGSRTHSRPQSKEEIDLGPLRPHEQGIVSIPQPMPGMRLASMSVKPPELGPFGAVHHPREERHALPMVAPGAEVLRLQVQNQMLQEQLLALQGRLAVLEQQGTPTTGVMQTTSSAGASAFSLTPSTGTPGSHRRVVSSDAGSTGVPKWVSCAAANSRTFVKEVEPGVFLTLEEQSFGHHVLRRMRFARKQYSHAKAEEWWNLNKERIKQQYGLLNTTPRPGVMSMTSPAMRTQIAEDSGDTVLSPNVSNIDGASWMLPSSNRFAGGAGPSSAD